MPQVLIGGRYPAHIRLFGRRGADSSVGPRFEDTQELGLELRMKRAEFVEKERPPFRLFDQTDTDIRGAGERPFLVTKEFPTRSRSRRWRRS